MIILAGLAWLPIRVLAALSIATIVLHHLADPMRAEGFWILLHQLGVIQFAGLVIISPYPLVPWFAVMALGFCLGPVFSWDADDPPAFLSAHRYRDDDRLYRASRRECLRRSVAVGVAADSGEHRAVIPEYVEMSAVAGFPADDAWSSADLLSWVDDRRSVTIESADRVRQGASVLLRPAFRGRAPCDRADVDRQYGTAALGFMFQPIPSMGGPADAFPPGFGYDLWVAYAVWIAIVAGLYPLCRWFAGGEGAQPPLVVVVSLISPQA